MKPASRDHEGLIVEALGDAVHGVTAPFVCSGTFVPELPIVVSPRSGPGIPFFLKPRGASAAL
jgi:hypothetical protein